MPSPATSPLKYTHTFIADAIGHMAQAHIADHPDGKIIGSTSRGFFIMSARQRVLFVSYEADRGPLTINLFNPPSQPLPVYVGQDVTLHPDQIIINSLRAHIIIEENAIWSPPPALKQVLPTAELDSKMRMIVNTLMNTKRGLGFVSLLAFIFDLTARPTVPITLQPTIVNVVLLKQQLFSRPFLESLPQLKELMGLGRGLTPSGDDFICGMLLLLNRMPLAPQYQLQIDDFNDQLVELAFDKTTALSANLIRAAARGGADERLLTAIDGILSGQLSEGEILNALENYGSSSGLDAFTGAGLVVQANLAAHK